MKYLKPLSLFHELMKSHTVERGLLLGLDVGDKYVGLAVSDFDYKIASPLSVLVRKKDNIDLMATDFQSLIRELPLSALIVGYPFDRQKNSPDAVQVKLFIDDLYDTGKLEDFRYTFWNESFTSKVWSFISNQDRFRKDGVKIILGALENVELLLKPLNFHPVHAKTIMDKFAAVGILQGYLDFANRNMLSDASDSE